MAKDDYYAVVFKVLVYLYAVLKRKIVYEDATFYHAIGKGINEDYLHDILYFMKDDGLIDGIEFTKAWGGTHLLMTDLSEMTITPKGIEYLTENSKMKSMRAFFLDHVEMISKLVSMLFER